MDLLNLGRQLVEEERHCGGSRTGGRASCADRT